MKVIRPFLKYLAAAFLWSFMWSLLVLWCFALPPFIGVDGVSRPATVAVDTNFHTVTMTYRTEGAYYSIDGETPILITGNLGGGALWTPVMTVASGETVAKTLKIDRFTIRIQP